MADNVTISKQGGSPTAGTVVRTKDIGGTQVQIVELFGRSTAFGELLVANLTPRIQLKFPYNINTVVANTTTTGSGTVTQANSMAIVNTTAAASSSAQLSSRRVLNYKPAQGAVVRFAGVFTTGVAGSEQVVGYGDDNDGYFFGYNGASFGVLRRQDGTDTWTAKASWSLDPADGTGTLPSIDPTQGNVYEIRFQWLGFGSIVFSIENPSTGDFIPVHIVEYPNQNTVPSIYNPSMPLVIKATNTTNDTAISISVSSLGGFVEGKVVDLGPIFSATSLKSSLSNTETNLITLRNKTTYQSETNREPIRLLFTSLSCDGNKNGVIRFIIGATLGGTPSYTDVNTANSVIEYDTAGTTITGGHIVATVGLGKSESKDIDVTPYDFELFPGQSLTISYQADGAATNEVRVSPTWRELI